MLLYEEGRRIHVTFIFPKNWQQRPWCRVQVCSHPGSQMTPPEDHKAAKASPVRPLFASRTSTTILQRRKEEHIQSYGTHAGMHVHDSRALYRCSKCENRYYDLYLLASHESGCKGKHGEITARFDSVFRVDYQKSMTSKAPCVLAIVRASREPPKAWKAGEEHLADGIKIWTKTLFDEFANDYDNNEGINATLIAMSYVHTSVASTGEFSQAHTTTDPTRRAYYARAYRYTHTIDRFLEHFTARGTKPIILSIGLDGFACKADLILPWLQRSPSFTLIIRSPDLVFGMDLAYFSQHNSGFYYWLFEAMTFLWDFHRHGGR